MSRPIAPGRWRNLAPWWSPRARAWVCVVSALALALGPLCRRAPIAHAQDTVSTGFIAVTPPNGNPFAQLPKPCWPEHLLIGRDTLFAYQPCNSLDVYPPGMRAQVECTMARMARGGWDALVFETWRSWLRQYVLWTYGRTRPGSIVTNAKDGSTGVHYYALAIDIIHRQRGWDHPRFFYWLMVHGEACGMVAGGAWKKFPDRPHLQWGGWPGSPPQWARAMIARGQRDSVHLLAGALR